MTTLRPFGPNVTFTASAKASTPFFKEALALMDVEKRHRFVETFLVCVDETLSDSLLSIAQNPEGNN